MLNVLIVVAAVLLAGYLAFSKRLASSSNWRATVTPLASIMGSGFLVCAPLLGGLVGNLALVCMAVLLALAYAVGSAIRFNIRHFEPVERDGHGPAQTISFLSRTVLAGAYFISVTYYLQLLAAFVLQAAGYQSLLAARVITSSLLLGISGIGMWRGLGMLERLEKYAVALNLGVIGGLLLALLVYNGQRLFAGSWQLPDVPTGIDGHAMRVLLGMLIVVQGFETSRYLGDEHPAEQRIQTMRMAQWISTAVYLVFLGLVTILFHNGLGADVTAIVSLTAPIAWILPALLSVAAIGSQFTAAVADCEGAGGLVEDLSQRRLPVRSAYLLILSATVLLTWVTDVNGIIAYASRAFALYYSLQCMVAFWMARHGQATAGRSLCSAGFAGLAVLCWLVFLLGLPTG